MPLEINLADPAHFQISMGPPLIPWRHSLYPIPSRIWKGLAFGVFVLSDAGKRILETAGLNPIEPVAEGNIENIPPTIRNYTTETEAAVITTPH